MALIAVDREEPFPFDVVLVEDRHGRRGNDQRVVAVLGELDVATAPRLRNVLLAEVDGGKSDLVVEMVGVEFIDVSGMRTLLDVAEQTGRVGGQLVLQAPSPPVRRLIDLLNLKGVIPIKE